jgi:hypothetical protein
MGTAIAVVDLSTVGSDMTTSTVGPGLGTAEATAPRQY